MKQITLSYTQEYNNVIVGKVIKGISFLRGEFCQEPQLIITFTDDTYIIVTAGVDEFDHNSIIFENGSVVPLECYYTLPGYVITDKDGKQVIKYEKNIEEQIRLGVVKPDTERELKKIQERKEAYEKEAYELYLELKKKYEPQ